MDISVSFIRDPGQQLPGIIDPNAFALQIANKCRLGIMTDTARGRGHDGEALPEYSESYKVYRQKRGAPTAFRDLFLDGTMFGSLAVIPVTDGAELRFTGAKEGRKAHGHHYGNPRRNLPATGFFQRSENDIKRYVQTSLDFLMVSPE